MEAIHLSSRCSSGSEPRIRELIHLGIPPCRPRTATMKADRGEPRCSSRGFLSTRTCRESRNRVSWIAVVSSVIDLLPHRRLWIGSATRFRNARSDATSTAWSWQNTRPVLRLEILSSPRRRRRISPRVGSERAFALNRSFARPRILYPSFVGPAAGISGRWPDCLRKHSKPGSEAGRFFNPVASQWRGTSKLRLSRPEHLWSDENSGL